MSNTLYKKITILTTDTSEPVTKYYEEHDNVAKILADLGVNADKSDVLVDDTSVDGSYVPESGARVVVNPKKYSSGSRF